MNNEERTFSTDDQIAALIVTVGSLISSLDQKTLDELDQRIQAAIFLLKSGQIDLAEAGVRASQSGTVGVLQYFLDHIEKKLDQT